MKTLQCYLFFFVVILVVVFSEEVSAQKFNVDTTTSDLIIMDPTKEDPNEKGHFHTPEYMVPQGSSKPQPNYPFKPCSCDVIQNMQAMKPDDPKSNIGFEENEVDKGISNWVFFMGHNRPWGPASGAYINNQAYFECNRYYTGNMVNNPTIANYSSAGYWDLRQESDFEKRTKVMSVTDNDDVVGNFSVVAPSTQTNNHSLRLNQPEDPPYLDNYQEKIFATYNSAVMAVRKVLIDKDNPYLTYKYAVALSNYFDHPDGHASYFRFQVFKINTNDPFECYDEICCESLLINAKAELLSSTPVTEPKVPGIKTNIYRSLTWGKGGTMGTMGNAKFKEWTTNTIDFSPYIDEGQNDATFIIAFTASYCKGNHDYGYAYIDLEPGTTSISYNSVPCAGVPVTFTGSFGNSFETFDPGSLEIGEGATWSVYKDNIEQDLGGAVNNQTEFTYSFPTAGNYDVKLTLHSANTSVICFEDLAEQNCDKTIVKRIVIPECIPSDLLICDDCINSFAPLPGKKYVLSAWVKQKHIPVKGLTTYTEPKIVVSYIGDVSTVTFNSLATSPIIDGWQKIEQEFTIPLDATAIQITLNGGTGEAHDVYYDDIRVFPFDAEMESFVYDPATQKLMAELDENHYATYYEYDEEGKLKRIKKETARGVMTVKEAGNNSSNR